MADHHSRPFAPGALLRAEQLRVPLTDRIGVQASLGTQVAMDQDQDSSFEMSLTDDEDLMAWWITNDFVIHL